MNDIGLLITSALIKGHPSVPYLFNEIAVELDLSVFESNLIQSTRLVTPARITPPEFIQTNKFEIASTVISPKNENVLRKIRNKVDSLDCCHMDRGFIARKKEPIIIKSSLEDNSPLTTSTIILPSTSGPRLTDAIENTPLLKQNFAGSPYQPTQVNSPSLFAGSQRLPILSFGTSGLSVKVLQRLLKVNGYPIRVDGNFGALTETAVKAFQSKRNLTVDGVVGLQTWQELTR
jgi:hypothetical protein